jgi:hypothetical protein
LTKERQGPPKEEASEGVEEIKLRGGVEMISWFALEKREKLMLCWSLGSNSDPV